MAEVKVKKAKASAKVEVVEQKKDPPKPKIKASDLPTLEAVRQQLGKIKCQYFIEKFVKIEDMDNPTDKAAPFLLWPKQVTALESLINNRLNIVLKSRQLGLTWLALAIAIWYMIYKPGYTVVALSKTETPDAKELIRRMQFILSNLPKWMITENVKENSAYKGLKWESTVLTITILHKPYPSTFISLSAGPDSGRSFTANLVILDEWAFQQWAKEIWSAAYPTINRPTGGKVIGLSSAKRMTMFEEIWRKATLGINTFSRVFLPWDTDPRRTQEWYEQSKLDLPNSYKAEYPATPEEAFEAAEGVAFPEYSYDIHVVKPFEIPKHWAKWRSVDNGYTDPFAWYWFTVNEQGTVFIYREFTREHKDPKLIYTDQASKVVELTGNEEIGYTIAGLDAWNSHHRDTSNKTLVNYYQDGGLFGFKKANTDRALRKATFHEYLKPYDDGNLNIKTAKLQIFDTCTKIIETLPQMLCDPRDNEKVMECVWDHWYDACLTEDTVINTVDGDYSIKDLVGKSGIVHCYDEVNGINTTSKFHNVRMTSQKRKVYQLTTEDGRTINATKDHQILTQDGWKELGNIIIGDSIIDIHDHI